MKKKKKNIAVQNPGCFVAILNYETDNYELRSFDMVLKMFFSHCP